MPKNSFDEYEDTIGYFDLAISYSGDASESAELLYRMSTYQGLRCYNYRNFLDSQFGYDIFDIMEFVYSQCRLAVVLNTVKYRSSIATKFEFDQIAKSSAVKCVFLFELGGPVVQLEHSRLVSRDRVSDDSILELNRLALEFRGWHHP